MMPMLHGDKTSTSQTISFLSEIVTLIDHHHGDNLTSNWYAVAVWSVPEFAHFQLIYGELVKALGVEFRIATHPSIWNCTFEIKIEPLSDQTIELLEILKNLTVDNFDELMIPLQLKGLL